MFTKEQVSSMVFKTISGFSRYSSTKASASHSFFDPSYIKQQKVSVVDGILGASTRNSSTSHPHPSISTSSNFIVFDPSFLQNNNNNNGNNSNEQANNKQAKRILLKKASHKVNKNGHVNISIDNITDQFTTLTLRRSNATTTKTIKINKSDFISANLDTQKLSVRKAAIAAAPVDTDNTHTNADVKSKEFDRDLDIDIDNSPMSTEDFLNFNYRLMGKYKMQGKTNEILSLYYHIKDRSMIPTLLIYSLVLESVPLRVNVKETTEENLTILLNVYSDMLANNIKPNTKIYTSVIMPLLNATIKSYVMKDISQAEQYFKISNELFNVSMSSNCQFPTELYEKLLICYNLMKYSGLQIEKLSNLMANKLGYNNILYYLGLLNLCKLSKNHQFALELYSQFKSLAYSYPHLLQHQLQVYSSLIRALVNANQIESAANILDQLILNVRSESGMQKDILPLISSFVVALAEIGLVENAYQTVEKFDAIPWLPKLPVNCLMMLVEKSCNAKEIDYALKFWNLAVVREDFDSSVVHSDNNLVNLIANTSSVETKSAFSKLVQLSFIYGDKMSIIRLSKELLIKDSLKVELPLIAELAKFLFANSMPVLAVKVLSNRGFKLNNDMKINQYLSLIIDIIPPNYYPELISSKLFKAAVDDYSLIDDNIYGLYKAIQTVWDHNLKGNESFDRKFRYCQSVLFEELNDLNNFYVETPQEIKDFKIALQQHLL